MNGERTAGDELAYALITPYSLHKSRTGGILARLLWADVALVAARMYAPRPGSGFIQDFCDVLYDPEGREISLKFQKLLMEYIVENFGKPNLRGISNRMMLLVFRGPNAIDGIHEAVGHLSQDVRGDNVRGTFGDYIHEEPSSFPRSERHKQRRRLLQRYPAIRDLEMPPRRNSFFEPAALTGINLEMTEKHLKLFCKYAHSDGGFVMRALDRVNEDDENLETSLVVLKPESFRHRNPLPGNLVDFFARTGMFITGAKLLRLSVEEAREFYEAKLPQFRRQLAGMVKEKARNVVKTARELAEQAVNECGADPETACDPSRALAVAQRAEHLNQGLEEYGPGEIKKAVVDKIYKSLDSRLDSLEPDESVYDEVMEELRELNACVEFNELIRYMTGRDPETGDPISEDRDTVCMALLYSGDRALGRIRTRLKELREVYGQNVLQNRAHASDPEEDPQKEMRVVGMPNIEGVDEAPCDVEQMVREFYGD